VAIKVCGHKQNVHCGLGSRACCRGLRTDAADGTLYRVTSRSRFVDVGDVGQGVEVFDLRCVGGVDYHTSCKNETPRISFNGLPLANSTTEVSNSLRQTKSMAGAFAQSAFGEDADVRAYEGDLDGRVGLLDCGGEQMSPG